MSKLRISKKELARLKKSEKRRQLKACQRKPRGGEASMITVEFTEAEAEALDYLVMGVDEPEDEDNIRGLLT